MATIDAGARVEAPTRPSLAAPLRAALLALLALAVVLPLALILRVSLLEQGFWLTRDGSGGLTLDAYGRAWTGVPFPRYFLNSLIVAGAVAIGSTLTAILAAYAFARARFRGRDALFLLVVGTLMIPSHITLIPNYLTFARMGMLDTLAALILPFLASGFSIFFLRQHMMGIPTALDEAARMDGAGTLFILRTIIVPLSWPAIAVVTLFSFMNAWNEFIWPLLTVSSEENRTVQIGLRYLLRDAGEDAVADWPLVMAGTVVTLLPLLIAYLVAERHLIRGLTMGSFR
jgi:multiple sugar transport system permease protein/sn-glycerol 3-phosphate transport system permease protein